MSAPGAGAAVRRPTERAADAGEEAAAPALLIRDLVRRHGEREALDGVSVRLERGRTMVVFGGNGAGKTTLLRVLATLLRPHGGQVEVLGSPLPREGWKVRAQIGYLGHDSLLYPELSARENLRFHAGLHRVAPARVDDLLERVGLGHRADDPVRELSRGMVQRVAAARAVLHRPELLLLDEPRAGLDPGAVALLEPLIGPAAGPARVLVTHDVEAGLAEADTVLGLRGGRMAFVGRAGPAQVRELYA